jgi:pyridoxine/pyridoxamine 5'-phosphate oxidase
LKAKYKNISAIASNQSEEIESYEILREKYDAIKAKVDAGEIQENRPSDWGGFQVKINYFEFWEAFEDRLNYRECYKKESDSWRKFFLQS